MKKVTDPEFRKYGRVLDLKIPDLLERLGKTPLLRDQYRVSGRCPDRGVPAGY